MKKSLTIALLTLCFIVQANSSFAQIELKTEYIGYSRFKTIDEKGKNTHATESRGSMIAYSGSLNLPLSYKLDKEERPIAWLIQMSGDYTSFSNRLRDDIELTPDAIGNLELSFSHIRPISKRWFIYASLGVGVYADHMNLERLHARNLMGKGSLLFMVQVRENLRLGVGVLFDSNFGYPMASPAFYIDWNLQGRFYLNAGMSGIKAGLSLTNWLNLNADVSINGSLAFMKRNDENQMFSHQYITAGLQPEFKIGKKITIPITFGVSASRTAYYQKRDIKSFFKTMWRDKNPYFKQAPYASIAFRYGF